MFTKKEVAWIIIVIIILTFIMGFTTDLESETASLRIITPLIFSTLIILTATITKKIAAPFFSIKIEYKIWEFKRYGFYKRAYLKKPFPIGLILPFSLTILSLGLIRPLTLLQFDAENISESRILKKKGRRRKLRKTEMNEADPAYTIAWGFYALLLLSIISAIITTFTNFQIFSELTKYSIYYGLWNLLPISNLDGTKLFFGSLLNWTLLAIIYIISLIIILII